MFHVYLSRYFLVPNGISNILVHFLVLHTHWVISYRIFPLDEILNGPFPESGACDANWWTKQPFPEGVPATQIPSDFTASDRCCETVPRLAN
jgi:hypothetical protein